MAFIYTMFNYLLNPPTTAPWVVTQVAGVVEDTGMAVRGHVAESDISWLIQLRKNVTRAMTEGAPDKHPSMPQDTIPMVS